MKTQPIAPDEAKAEALERLSDQGPGHINCAQAVLLFTLLVTGSDLDSVALARQFGGGIAGTGETCGAVTGAAFALGLRDHLAGDAADPAGTRAALQELVRDFESEFGALRCRDLTGCDLTTPEGHDAFVKGGGPDRCRSFVDWMCDQILPLAGPPR